MIAASCCSHGIAGGRRSLLIFPLLRARPERSRTVVDRGAATGRTAARCGAAVALAAASLLAHAGAALLPRARAGTRLRAGVLRLRELKATGRRIGRDGGGDSEGCCGPSRRLRTLARHTHHVAAGRTSDRGQPALDLAGSSGLH